MAPLSLRAVEGLVHRARGFFDGDGPVWIARAPGRLDVIGGIADYSGGLVLEGTLAEATFAAVQRRRDDVLRVQSLGEYVGRAFPRPPDVSANRFSRRASERPPNKSVELRLADLAGFRGVIGYAKARTIFSDPTTHWAAYVLGIFHVLQREKAVHFPGGANILVASDVPIGAGVSSSAALEVSAMCAVLAAFGMELGSLDVARLCQIVENRVVGAPCGIMDQITCMLGEKGRLLALLCRPHDVTGLHDLPHDWRLIGINSNIKHSVGGSRYTKARVAGFMGLTIAQARLKARRVRYLTELTPREYLAELRPHLPAKIRGCEFLRQYGETVDTVTHVDPDVTYSVRACTEHPIYEHQRVHQFIQAIRDALAGDASAIEQAGKLMYAAHWSYGKRAGLGCRETDLLVNLVRRRGPEKGLFGAKISGGGSGGTVAILANPQGAADADAMAEEYHVRTGIKPDLFRGSSLGARQFGVKQVSV